MKPEYAAYRDELIAAELKRYKNPETVDIPYMLKGRCRSWSLKFAEKWLNLRVVTGFYGGSEHFWCVDMDDNDQIVDPTVAQFRDGAGDPRKYRVYDPDYDEIYLGKCMNCGIAIYGLQAMGRQEVCGDECQTSLEDYYNGMISGSRGGYG